MTLSEETLTALWKSEQAMREKGMEPLLCTLCIYWGALSGAPTSQKDAYTTLHLNDRTVANSFRVLIEMGFISKGKAKSSKMTVKVNDLAEANEPFNLRELSLLLISIQNTNIEKKHREGGTKVEAGQFSEADIMKDDDWKTAEAILLKYFKPHQINPKLLTYKKRFESLCNLLSDSTFDFDLYCRWYREHKYPQKKFNYGLFLFPDMITEFQDSIEELKEGDTYLKTSSRLEDSDSFKKGLKETEEFLKTLQDEES